MDLTVPEDALREIYHEENCNTDSEWSHFLSCACNGPWLDSNIYSVVNTMQNVFFEEASRVYVDVIDRLFDGFDHLFETIELTPDQYMYTQLGLAGLRAEFTPDDD